MSNIQLEKIWQLWSPEELDIKDKKKKQCIADDLFLEKNKKKLSDHKKITHNSNKKYYENGFKEGYKIGYQKGAEKKILDVQQHDKLSLQHRMYKFIADFELGLASLDTIIIPNLIQLALQISKKITGEIPVINHTILLEKIKKFIKIHPILSNKPKLRVNPYDQSVIEKNFGDILNLYGWNIIYDDNISQGGCILDADNINIDATIPMLWKQLSQDVSLNEKDS